MKHRISTTVVALSLAALTQAAFAEITEGRTQQDRRFIAGGIGLDEAEQMRQKAREFPLQVTFAHPQGAFLANIDVRIRDRNGNVVLEQTIDAPILLVDLPAGSYTIEADKGDRKQKRQINIGQGGHQQVLMSFNVPVDQPGSAAQVPSGEDVLGQQREAAGKDRPDSTRGTTR